MKRHLLSIDELDRSEVSELLDLTDHFVEVNRRAIPKVPALRGKTVVSLFFEDSTRTRLSFETAARRLSADTMTFSVGTSSVKKGESYADTVETLSAFGVRRLRGAPPLGRRALADPLVDRRRGGQRRRRHAPAPHPGPHRLVHHPVPTWGRWKGATSPSWATSSTPRWPAPDVAAFTKLGATVHPGRPAHPLAGLARRLAGAGQPRPRRRPRRPRRLLPAPDAARADERGAHPEPSGVHGMLGLTARRADRLGSDALIMHPGPMNRGVEIAPEAADRPNAVITEQVANGVSVRMAVLFRLLGSGSQLAVFDDSGAGPDT